MTTAEPKPTTTGKKIGLLRKYTFFQPPVKKLVPMAADVLAQSKCVTSIGTAQTRRMNLAAQLFLTLTTVRRQRGLRLAIGRKILLMPGTGS